MPLSIQFGMQQTGAVAMGRLADKAMLSVLSVSRPCSMFGAIDRRLSAHRQANGVQPWPKIDVRRTFYSTASITPQGICDLSTGLMEVRRGQGCSDHRAL